MYLLEVGFLTLKSRIDAIISLMKLIYSSYISNPKNVCFDGEDNDEKILLILRKHFITNLKWILIALFLFNLPEFAFFILKINGVADFSFLPLSYRFVLSFFWVLVSFGFFFSEFLTWYFSVYIVSTKRVVDIDFSGFMHRRFSEALLTNIQDLTHQISGVSQIIFHYGTLFIQTAGEKQEIEFEHIPSPAKAQDFISDLTRGVQKNLGTGDLGSEKVVEGKTQ